MRKTLFILFFLPLSSHSQLPANELNSDSIHQINYQIPVDSINHYEENETSKKIRLGFCFNLSLTSDGLPASVLLTVSYRKHQIDLGPRFGLGSFAVGSYQKVIGGELNYRFYLTGDEKWFSSYALFHLGYFYRRLNYSTVFEPAAKETKISTEAYLGYGIKFNIVKGFYIGTYVGLGWYRSKRNDIDGILSSKKTIEGWGGVVSGFIGYKF